MGTQSFLARFIPLRFRKSVPVVNHVVLHGAIGIGTPAAARRSPSSPSNAVLERAFRPQGPRRRGDQRQFAGRLARAVGPDPRPHPGAGGGEQAARPRVLRGCGGLGRLLAGLRGRRDLCRRKLDHRLDRRHLGGLRLRRGHRQARRRAPRPHLGRIEVHARSVPAGKAGGRGPSQEPAGRRPPGLQGPGPQARAAASSRARTGNCSPAPSGPAGRRWPGG